MYLIEVATTTQYPVTVERLADSDYKLLTKSRFYFDWKAEKENEIYKLMLEDEILGVMSLIYFANEERIEIKLIAVATENKGRNKKYDRIAGTLIGFACQLVDRQFGDDGLVSLMPKTHLKQHYLTSYGMCESKVQLYLTGQQLTDLIEKFEI